MIIGIDTSYANYRPNGEVGDIDWERAIASKTFSFVYARVGQGAVPGNLDGLLFNESHDQCKKVGMPFGAYFFFVAHQDGNSQADIMLPATDGRYGTIAPMIDVEEASFQIWIPMQDRINNLANLRLRVAKQYKIAPSQVLIYTNWDTWTNMMGGSDAFRGSPLWQATNSKDPTHVPYPINGFKKAKIQQYDTHGSIPGLMGDVDLDALYGTIDDLKLPS